MNRGIRHILAFSALATLSACASGYVSGYDEIKQRQGQQAQQPRQASTVDASRPAGQPRTAPQSTDSDLIAPPAAEGPSEVTTVALPPSTVARRKGGSVPAASKPQTVAQPATGKPAPEKAPQSKPAAPAIPAAKPDEPAAAAVVHSVEGGTVTVKAGETLFAIARRTGAELRDLILANDLEPPYAVRSGQVLKIPAARYHVVQPGETGYSISRLYDTDLTVLARLNGLEAPYAVRLGQRLRLPAAPSSAGAPEPKPSQVAAKPAPEKAPNKSPEKTETAKAPPSPGSVKPADASTDAAKAPVDTAAKPAAPVVASNDTAAKPAPRPIAEPAAFSGRFSWPLTGRILSRFGPRAGGLHNDGINIAAQRGATVRAAAPGVVAYAGDGLKGFGWLVLIKHGDGWVTAYAHNDTILVKRGDKVRGGEPIARAGATGAVDRPQLHFEIRRGRRAVNPLELLPPSPLS